MKIIINLLFSGNCREAFEHYEKVLGGEIRAMMPFGSQPQEATFAKDFPEAIMHAWLQVGDQAIMGGDAPPARRQAMAGFTASIHFEDPAEARRVYEGLAEGGSASMPFGPTFWSPGFGVLTDRFGTPWTINCEAPRAEGGAG